MRSAPAEIGVFAQRGLVVVRLSLTVGVRCQLQQIPRILDIPSAAGEVTKTAGAVAQVSDSEHGRFWHTAGSILLSWINWRDYPGTDPYFQPSLSGAVA